MKKELKSGILSADKSADGRPTVFLVNVIAVLKTSKPFVLSIGPEHDKTNERDQNIDFCALVFYDRMDNVL